MKKNWTLRAGVLMLALTLITSCFVGGTFAKYVTSDSGKDSARVAKFGVTVTGTGTMFATGYDADDGSYTGVTVQSTENVVAPGTSGNMAAVTITGTPEVAVRVTYSVTEFELSDNWKDATDSYYCPLEITIGTETLKGSSYTSTDLFEEAVKEKIEGLTNDYAPGTDLSTKDADNLAISWNWAFDTNDDVKDTFLGDQAAEGNAATISLKFNTTVTQID